MPMYKYYAVIEKEIADNTECYIVSFPDLEDVFTDGETLSSAVMQAEDVLGLMLTEYEDKGKVIPAASAKGSLQAPEGSSMVLIEVDTDEYRKAV